VLSFACMIASKLRPTRYQVQLLSVSEMVSLEELNCGKETG